jgi:tRNA threonylcarbamoyladenosine modification (KEOPS) complex  Pcc1 subunit
MLTEQSEFRVMDPEKTYRALKPDMENTSRFEVSLKQKKNSLSLEIRAKDKTAMKAAKNSYKRLINLIGGLE